MNGPVNNNNNPPPGGDAPTDALSLLQQEIDGIVSPESGTNPPTTPGGESEPIDPDSPDGVNLRLSAMEERLEMQSTVDGLKRIYPGITDKEALTVARLEAEGDTLGAATLQRKLARKSEELALRGRKQELEEVDTEGAGGKPLKSTPKELKSQGQRQGYALDWISNRASRRGGAA